MAFRASSSLEDSVTKAAQHRRLDGTCDCEAVSIYGETYYPATTTILRVPPASLTPGAPRDRPSAAQAPRQQQDHRHAPDRDGPARGAGPNASSPRVPDARRAPRPPLGVAGTSTTTRSTARSRPRSASSRRCGSCEFPSVPDARRGARPTLGVAGASSTTTSRTRSRPRSASSRR